ncbi:hypothetical protein EGI16_21515 [Chryseobacterium sp. G0240]|uniref:hypothetical protein n=1 Tax=Chryseobacterium sp. G0240 TaxID=2487066 RepID=UPI000F4525A6|nr:hypothetical protein [Chryseobacterium sp. G0240]ROH98416.1 hypothetical protein EGI16_21515 [Chryseobacterium sp. G0240]
MQRTKIKRGQSLIDIVIQGTGSITDLIQTAIINNRSVTDNLSINDQITTGSVVNNDQVMQFISNPPATSISSQSIFEQEKGIGKMKIGINFKIN